MDNGADVSLTQRLEEEEDAREEMPAPEELFQEEPAGADDAAEGGGSLQPKYRVLAEPAKATLDELFADSLPK